MRFPGDSAELAAVVTDEQGADLQTLETCSLTEMNAPMMKTMIVMVRVTLSDSCVRVGSL